MQKYAQLHRFHLGPSILGPRFHILMLIKRPPQFTGFVENKYRRENVMICKS